LISLSRGLPMAYSDLVEALDYRLHAALTSYGTAGLATEMQMIELGSL
jgi:hypothetical protein